MDEIKKTLQNAIDYLDDIIENPDKVIKIKTSPEYLYINDLLKAGISPDQTPEKEG